MTTITNHANPFADDITVEGISTLYDWRTDSQYDCVTVNVSSYAFKIDRDQAIKLGMALISAAHNDVDFYGRSDEVDEDEGRYDYYDDFAQYEGISAHWGHD